jgi:hypothetical protein
MNNKNGKIVNIILLSNSNMIIPLFVRNVSSQAKYNLHSMAFLQIDVISTVKLGYYELGYNELPVITNISLCLVGSSQTNKTFSWL